MSGTIINLIIQLIAGAIGGNAAGAAAKNVSLGTAGNTVAGAVGGIAGGSLLTSLIPMLQAPGAAWTSAPFGPIGRRRRVRRDCLSDYRHGDEQHEERLSAFARQGRAPLFHTGFFRARINPGLATCPFVAIKKAAGAPADAGSTNSWD